MKVHEELQQEGPGREVQVLQEAVARGQEEVRRLEQVRQELAERLEGRLTREEGERLGQEVRQGEVLREELLRGREEAEARLAALQGEVRELQSLLAEARSSSAAAGELETQLAATLSQLADTQAQLADSWAQLQGQAAAPQLQEMPGEQAFWPGQEEHTAAGLFQAPVAGGMGGAADFFQAPFAGGELGGAADFFEAQQPVTHVQVGQLTWSLICRDTVSKVKIHTWAIFYQFLQRLVVYALRIV